jgi:membrane protease YdiL (CAAX protease family)
MNKMLPRPRFWADAALQIRNPRPFFSEMLVYLVLTFLAYLGQSIIIAIPVSGWLLQSESESMMEALSAGESIQSLILRYMEQMPDWMVPVSLAAGGTMGVVAVVYCLKFQKRNLVSMGLGGKRRGLEFLAGLILGAVLLCAAVGLGVAAGGYRFVSASPDFGRLGLLALTFLACLIYGASLELLTRGYFAPSLGSRAPVGFALTVSTLAAAFMQAGGSLFSLTAANHVLLGLVLGILVLKRGNLWCACALHSAWVFAESFLFDVAPAEAHGSLRLFEVDADQYRPLISGGEYGPANSICTTVVLLAAVAVVLALKAKDPLPPEPEPAAAEPRL